MTEEEIVDLFALDEVMNDSAAEQHDLPATPPPPDASPEERRRYVLGH